MSFEEQFGPRDIAPSPDRFEFQIAKLQMQPNDVLVIKTNMPPMARARALKAARMALGEDVKVLFI